MRNYSMVLLALLASSSLAIAAPTVQNGSFTRIDINGDFAPGNNTLPSGWTTGASGPINTPDTIDENNNFGFTNPPTASGNPLDFAANPDMSTNPDGGTWVALARDDTNFLNESVTQTVSGFTSNTLYTVSWLEGNFGYDHPTDNNVDFVNENSLQLTIDGINFFGIVRNDTFGPQSSWIQRSFTFEALDAEYDFTFGLRTGSRAYLSLDDFDVTEANIASPVPEQPTYVMIALGALLVSGYKRYKHS